MVVVENLEKARTKNSSVSHRKSGVYSGIYLVPFRRGRSSIESKPLGQHQFFLFAVEYLRQHVASNLVGIHVTLPRRDQEGFVADHAKMAGTKVSKSVSCGNQSCTSTMYYITIADLQPPFFWETRRLPDKSGGGKRAVAPPVIPTSFGRFIDITSQVGRFSR